MLVNFYILHGVNIQKDGNFCTHYHEDPKIYFLTKIVFAHPAVQLKQTTEYDVFSHLIAICVAVLYIMFSSILCSSIVHHVQQYLV
jgi:hypothetical protein